MVSSISCQYHEAGHAVAGVVIGRDFEFVTVIPIGNTEGHVAYSTADDPEFPRPPQLEAIFFIAGPYAECRRTRRSLPRLWIEQQDASDVAALQLSEADFRKAVSQSMEIIDKNWPAVRRVAAALRRRQKLTFEEVEAMVFSA